MAPISPLKVDVSGECVKKVPAERATLHLGVSSSSTDQQEASDNVANTSASLRALLQSLATKLPNGEPAPDAAVTRWFSGTLSTGSNFEYDKDGKPTVRIHHASTSFDVEFSDFTRLGSVSSQLSAVQFVSISGIEWSLTAHTQAECARASRKEAVVDAMEKAEDFAHAAGKEGVRVVEIREEVPSMGRFGGAHAMHMACAPGHGAHAPVLHFEPQACEVTCSLRVSFEAT